MFSQCCSYVLSQEINRQSSMCFFFFLNSKNVVCERREGHRDGDRLSESPQVQLYAHFLSLQGTLTLPSSPVAVLFLPAALHTSYTTRVSHNIVFSPCTAPKASPSFGRLRFKNHILKRFNTKSLKKIFSHHFLLSPTFLYGKN